MNTVMRFVSYIYFVSLLFFKICTLISLIDKYGALVTGEAAEHVKQFISSECSFEDYTQVMICLLENIVERTHKKWIARF